MSVPCEACLPQRIEMRRSEMQAASSLTEAGKSLRLAHIPTRPGSGAAQMVKACRGMLKGRASLLTFWGAGRGLRSAALIATVNEFLDRGLAALYLPARDLLTCIQQALHNGVEVGDDSALDRLERFKQVRVLAIDKLRAARITDWRLEQIRSLLDWRWRRGIAGACCTLLAMDEDPGLLEPRLCSRLYDGRNRLRGDPVLHNSDPE